MTERILNITNGDCAVAALAAAAMPGDPLPWRDILHEGPVPGGLDLAALSEVRARFIAERGWASLGPLQAEFAARDARLAGFRDYDRVRFWFEHDLYDQLQLLQLLDWFAGEDLGGTRLTLLCTDEYLGPSSADAIRQRLSAETAVAGAQLELARRAWAAFRQPTPEAWVALLRSDLTQLPFLEGAIRRTLEEYPHPRTGLSRTAFQALCLVAQGEDRFNDLFKEYQTTEERSFMGDLGFYGLLHTLAEGEWALLTIDRRTPAHLIDPEQRYGVTDQGREVLAGRASAGEQLARDRWIGGVHLRPDRYWTWDAATDTLSGMNA
ncbi:hypothetical protein [Marinobacter fonticola]|uniref:hypothetical protein n=1 Tax=Marinobacter fonticola TaxID=2603215 RepID=UPI0011E75A1E|nr:hypothetical protein [Marinobacter fonticola]